MVVEIDHGSLTPILFSHMFERGKEFFVWANDEAVVEDVAFYKGDGFEKTSFALKDFASDKAYAFFNVAELAHGEGHAVLHDLMQ